MSDNNNTESNSPDTTTTPSPAFSLATVIEDAKKIITNPTGFYREMPTEGGYANPLIFVIVMGAITGIVISLTTLIGFGNALVAGGMALASIIVFPIFAVIGCFIGAAFVFVIWKLMGSEKNYEVAYRCVAYTMAIGPIIAIFSIIPYLGTIVKSLWSPFLLYIASTEVHNLKATSAKIVFGVLAVIGVMFGVNSEKAARNMQNVLEDTYSEYSQGELPEAFKNLENIENMTPEEVGKAAGEFLKGLEGFSKGLEESINEGAETAE